MADRIMMGAARLLAPVPIGHNLGRARDFVSGVQMTGGQVSGAASEFTTRLRRPRPITLRSTPHLSRLLSPSTTCSSRILMEALVSPIHFPRSLGPPCRPHPQLLPFPFQFQECSRVAGDRR